MQIDDEEYLKIVSDILNDSRFLNLNLLFIMELIDMNTP